jgi:hypothetical protein
MPLPKHYLMAIMTLLGPVLWSQDAEKPKSKTESKDKAKEGEAAQPTETSGGMAALGSLIPQGVKNKNVQIPGFKDGRPSSMITAKAVTRQSDNELFAEDMIIKLFNEQPSDNVRVDLNTAIFNMQSKVLTSSERSRVSRSDFQIEGDTLEFDTTTSQGKMKGRVQMIIYDTTRLNQKKKPETTAKTPPSTGAAPVTPATTPTPNSTTAVRGG